MSCYREMSLAAGLMHKLRHLLTCYERRMKYTCVPAALYVALTPREIVICLMQAQHVSTDDDAGMIAMNEDADMIARAGNFLIEQLSKHETELQHLEMTLLRQGMCTLGVGAAAILLAAWAYWRRK